MTLHTVFIKASQTSILIPVILGVQSFKKLTNPFKYLLYFLIASVFFEIQASVLKMIYHNNMPGLHLFTFVEFMTMIYVYFKHFEKSKTLKNLILLNTLLFVLIAFTDAFIINDIWKPNNISRTFSALSLVCWSLVFFFDSIKNDYYFFTWEDSMFWFNTSIFIYFSLNLFYFMLNNYLVEHAFSIAYNSMRVHALINMASNLLLGKSFACFNRTQVR